MNRAGWIVAGTALTALDVWLCLFRMSDMLGNLEAQMVIILPGFVVSHLVAERRHRRADAAAERRHAEILAAHQQTTTAPTTED
ncbi:hypothetical protein ABH931_006166 [Streptacidiphilus sp. MAP12-33]|uniref:hypothetical protein n=1 Tax=Streptacidiphilus sp. MAP12-33 TaxID=3156266 RepID=UPI003510E232